MKSIRGVGGKCGHGFSERILILVVTTLLMIGLFPLSSSAPPKSISLRDPNGGEVLVAGSTIRISWSISGGDGFIFVRYSSEIDGEFELIASLANTPSHGMGWYDWFIPPNLNSTHCLVKVTWTSSLGPDKIIYAEDTSDNYFTIKQDVLIDFRETPTIVSYGRYYLTTFDLFDPNGLVSGLRFTWRVDNGSGYSTWMALPGMFDFYDPKKGWIWWMPSYYETATAQMRVQALAEDRTTVLDEDYTNPFQIISPGLTLIQPDGGVVLNGGSTYTIKWRTSEDPEKVIIGVHIFYSLNGGNTWTSMGYADNTFEYEWTVPDVASSRVRVKVISLWGEWYSYASDESTADNVIITDSSTPTVTLLDPNPPVDGGVVLVSGEAYMIRYSVTGSSRIDSIQISYSLDNGSIYTPIRTLTGSYPGIYYWFVPFHTTYEGKIRIYMRSSSQPDMMASSIHPFYIFNSTEVNRYPVAIAEGPATANEGEIVMLSGVRSYDPDGDPLNYSWTVVEPDFMPVTLYNPNFAQPFFIPQGLKGYPINFIFELTVSDGIEEHMGVPLYNVGRVAVEVEPLPPTLNHFTPDTGWAGTPLTIYGDEMSGSEVYIGDSLITRIPSDPYPANPDPEHTFNLTIPEDLAQGIYNISLRNLNGEAISDGEIEIFPRPTWNYNYGLGFHNPTKHLLNYPWDPQGTGRYKDAFGNQVYLNIWVCIGIPYWTPWDGWECAGYLVEEPFAPDPLAAIYYGAVFCWIARYGECFGMSATSLMFYHGDLSVSDYRPLGSTKPSELENGGELRRHIDWRQGSQMSAEILGVYLDNLISGLVPSSELTGLGLWVNTVKSSIDSGELGIATMISGEGAHCVVPYAYEENGDTIRFYVYDSNREMYSNEIDSIEACVNGNDNNDNPPYIEVNRHGVYWEWSFRSVDGSLWKSTLGLSFIPYRYLKGDRTLPVSIEGIIELLVGDATMRVADESGNVSGVSESGDLLWGIDGAAPLPLFSGSGYLPQSYQLPTGNYTVYVDGNNTGFYNLSLINNGMDALSIENAEVAGDSEDTVRVTYPDGNPYGGYLWYGTTDKKKEYDAKIVHKYEHGSRTFKIIGADLTDTGEHGIGVNENYTGIKFTNNGTKPVTFDVEFQGSISCQRVWNGTDPPKSPHLPTARRENVTVGPGETVTIMPLNWFDLDHTMVIIEGESVPHAPENLTALFEGRGVRLNWETPSEDSGFPVLQYRIYRGESAEEMTLLAIFNGNTYLDTNVTRGRVYYYSVSAINVLGEGIRSPAVSVEIPQLTPPSSPLNLTTRVTGEGVIITWSPPEDDGGSPITGYIIYRGSSLESMKKIAEMGNVTEYLDTEAEAGKTYYYFVTAVNSIGEGNPSEMVMVKPMGEKPEMSLLPILIVLALLIAAVGGYLLLKKGRGVGPPEE